MRYLLIVLFSLCGALLLSTHAAAVDAECYVTVSALQYPEAKSVRTVMPLDGNYRVGVWGGETFLLKINSSYPVQAEEMMFATSEGKLASASEGMVEYRCDYLVSYYGLAIVQHLDGYIGIFPFRLGPIWDLEDEDKIPDVHPEIVRPISPDPAIDELIEIWWNEEVVPADEEWRRDFFADTSEDED